MILILNKHFQTNLALHSVSTRNRDHLHRPTASLSCFFKKMLSMLASKSSTGYHEI